MTEDEIESDEFDLDLSLGEQSSNDESTVLLPEETVPAPNVKEIALKLERLNLVDLSEDLQIEINELVPIVASAAELFDQNNKGAYLLQGSTAGDFELQIKKLISQVESMEKDDDTAGVKFAIVKCRESATALRLEAIAHILERGIALVDRAKKENQKATALKTKYRSVVEEAQRGGAKVAQILDALNLRVEKEVDYETTQNFAKLAKQHATTATWWLWGLVFSTFATLGAVIWIISYEADVDANVSIVVGELAKRLIMLSAPVTLLRICLTKYNAERHLKIVYDHRSTIWEQSRLLESPLQELTKFEFRVELFRLLLKDPDTGYSKSKNADININPILGTVEKMLKNGVATS